MSNSSKIKAIECDQIDVSAISLVAWNPFFANGLPKACSMIKIINDSNIGVTISYDGATDHDYVLKNSTTVLNFQANAGPNGNSAEMPKGTPISLGSREKGVGIVVCVGYYQE